jgi:hypothetical protein
MSFPDDVLCDGLAILEICLKYAIVAEHFGRSLR